MNKIKKIAISILFFILIVLISNMSDATTISISPENPKKGDKINVTVTVPNVHTATVKVNVSGAGISDKIQVVGGDLAGEIKNFSSTKEFVCNEEGVITVETTTDSRAILDGNDVDVAAKKTVTVTAPVVNKTTETEETVVTETPTETEKVVELSTNANLRNLGIQPNDFSGFKPSTLTYTTEVPNNVSKVKIYAYAQDSKAKITGIGDKNLSEGNNSFDIVVTAEDGKTTKTYNLTIKRQTKAEKEAAEKAESEKKEVDLTLTSLEIENVTLTPEFKKDVYSYTGKLKKEVEKVDVKATAADSNVKVEVSGNNKIVSGKNEIKIKLTSQAGKTAEYVVTLNIENEVNKSTKGLSKLEINDVKISPSFSTTEYNYVATLTKDVKKLNITALNSNGTTDGIEITGNDDIQYGDNTITILVTDKETGDITTYQILLTKELLHEEEKEKGGTNIGKIVLTIAAIIIIITLIVLLKPKKKKRNAFGDEVENQNINFDDDDYNPFFNNKKIEDKKSFNIEDEKNEVQKTQIIDRSKEYDVFSDDELLGNNVSKKNNIFEGYQVEKKHIDENIEDDIDDDDDISREDLNKKRRGKHF